MKKFLIILLCLFLLIGCKKEEDEAVKEVEIKPIESSIQYISYREKQIKFFEEFNSYFDQFKGLNCEFISRDSNNPKLFKIDEITTPEDEFYSLSGGTSFLITCPYENTHSNVSFSGVFTKKEDKLFKDRKLKEWHISTTSEEVSLYIDENTSIKLGGSENDTIKTLKEKLGSPTSENTSVRGYVDKLIYEKDKFNYEYQVLDPFKDNSDSKIYALYIIKR